MIVVGLDGYPKGWVAVSVEGRKHSLTFLRTIAELEAIPHGLAMIDIPIGLPSFDNRECDTRAKTLLGRGGARVFTGARRGYWDFKDRATANRYYKDRNDKGISCQLWCLGPKIREVDDYMTPQRQTLLRETHPELAFYRLNGHRLLPRKKSVEGRRARRDLLLDFGFDRIDEWLDRTRFGTGANADDILDACVCAIVAHEPCHRLPSQPKTDDKGLRMEMWY